MPTTSPDNISYPDINTVQDQPAYMGAHASSVQAALSMRQRYTYVWANDAARAAATGMTAGSLGYQLDTKTEYKYENGSWRLATAYVEYDTSNVTIPNATYVQPPFTLNAANSTSTTFTSYVSPGIITITDPGIYAFSWYFEMSVPFNGSTFIAISNAVAGQGGTQFYAVNPFVANVATAAVPFLKFPGANTRVYFALYQTSGAQVTTNVGKLRIGRVA